MRLALLLLAACQQDKPVPVVAAVADARVVAAPDPPPLLRTASAPRFSSGAGLANDALHTLTFDAVVVSLESVRAPEDVRWLVTVAGPVTIVDEGKRRAHHVATDLASRSFEIDLPAGVTIDLHVGQQLRGTVTSIPGIFVATTATRLEDDRGVVFELDPGTPTTRIGKQVTGLGGAAFEEIHAIEVQLDGKTWTSLAGWSTWSSYAVYGLAGDVKPDAVVYDYFPWRTFAMVRRPPSAM